MKPTNRFYGYSPSFDEPEECVMINCTYCKHSAYSIQWRKNEGDCPRCDKQYAGQKNED